MSVAKLAIAALRDARIEALEGDLPFVEVRDGKLVEVFPGGEVRYIRDIEPPRRVLSPVGVPAE